MTSPTQPHPTWPKPFERQGITDDDLIDFTPELKQEAKAIVSTLDHGPLFTPPTERGVISLPGWGGGGNWWGAAIDPETNTIYIPSITMPIRIGVSPPRSRRLTDFDYMRAGAWTVSGPQDLPLTKPPYGRVTAIDLDTGEHVWMVPHGDGPRDRVKEVTGKDPGPLGGGSTGPVLTKSLLFLGQGGLTNRGRGGDEAWIITAFDKATGEVVHEIELSMPPAGTPMTYMADGKQYLCIAVGGSEDSRLIALALP